MSGTGLALTALRAVRFLRLHRQISRPAAALLSDLLLVGGPVATAQRTDGAPVAVALWVTEPIQLDGVAGGYSRRHARRARRALEDLGLVVVVRRPWGASIYRVRIGRLFALARTETQRAVAVRLASAAEA